MCLIAEQPANVAEQIWFPKEVSRQKAINHQQYFEGRNHIKFF
jgi:hypothetical protein